MGSRLGWLAGAAHWAARHRRGTWLAQGYAAAVAAVAVGIQILPAGTASALVLDSSTNLHNLHHDPLVVLAVSAFVVSSLAGLWILPVLLVVYGAAQRWLGAAATIVAALLGHVGATLLVAVLLAAGIGDGRLDPAVADARDVGVSYGLVTVAAVLTARFRGFRQVGYALAVLGYCAVPAVAHPDFTDLGHLLSAAIGYGIALIAVKAARAAPVSGTRPDPAGGVVRR